jgi:hypothetical protein
VFLSFLFPLSLSLYLSLSLSLSLSLCTDSKDVKSTLASHSSAPAADLTQKFESEFAFSREVFGKATLVEVVRYLGE